MKFTDKKKVWSLRYTPGNCEVDAAIAKIAAELGISEVSARLIYNRGHVSVAEARDFLGTSLDVLHDPYLMKDMDRAVARIESALENNEKITVYGDYDVDGVTSVTLIYLYLRSIGADIDYYIPSRAKEGYGLSVMALDKLAQNGTKLIVTVDTGITANAEVDYARELGIEMVITDHHECHEILPDACAVVNPHRPDCSYPFSELAGVGVVFKLACALELKRCAGESALAVTERICARYIDLVAIGTVADVMPLIDENRVIVKHGLELIAKTDRLGLAALIDAINNSGNGAQTGTGERFTAKKRKVNAGFIGFGIAPRINAAGRISSAEKAVALLLSDDKKRAAGMAAELCEINHRRQIEENSIAEEAYAKIEEKHNFERDRVIVLDADGWQQGIIGIVASRITEKYGLPSILISFDGAIGEEPSPADVGKGSGRSIKGMNLVDALDYCRDLLVRFGGHELAAGLSVTRENVDAFRQKINEYAREKLTEDLSFVRYEADLELSPSEITLKTVSEINMLEPFGVANQTPSFIVKGLTLDKIIPMGAGKHSKLVLSCGGRSYQAVCFGMAAQNLDVYPGDKLDLFCQLNINEFRGQTNLQLVVGDVRLSADAREGYEREVSRYGEIVEGATFEYGEHIIPSRADVAELYKLFRKENSIGNYTFTYRMLRSLLSSSRETVNYSKIRFALSILRDMEVCDVEKVGDGKVSVQVRPKAEKTSIENSRTYRQLTEQMA